MKLFIITVTSVIKNLWLMVIDMTGTYYTDMVGLPAQIINNPYFVMACVAIIGVFMLVMLFIMIPMMLMQDMKNRRRG